MIRQKPLWGNSGWIMKIIELEETGSTNEYCKNIDCGEDLIVIANRQTAGKGTKGRSFISDGGGLYVSVMRHYENYPAENAFRILIDGCVAVCRTLEAFGVPAVIRWSNDVLVNGKKISGTLIENTFSNGFITRSIVGIGVNVNNEIASQINDIAVSMQNYLCKPLCLESVKKVFINNLLKHYTINDYKSYINWFGREITLKTQDAEYKAAALDVSDSGRLIVDRCGDIIEISSAEVSLRL